MWFTRTDDGFRGWFTVLDVGGTVKTGLNNSSFDVTVINPQDTASVVPFVSQSDVKPGLYRFDVPNSFLLTHGTGSYGTLVEINAGLLVDALSEVIKVSQADFDHISASATVDTAAIADAVWDEQMSNHQVSGSGGFILSQLSGTLENISSSIDYSSIAYSVWDEDLDIHSSSIGSAGHELGHVHNALIMKHGKVVAGDNTVLYVTTSMGSSPNGAHNGLVFMVFNEIGRTEAVIKDHLDGGYNFVKPLAFVPAVDDSVFVLTQNRNQSTGKVR